MKTTRCLLLRISLGISWLLWGLALLHLLRVTSVFLPVHKFLGPMIYVNHVIYNWGNIPAEVYERDGSSTHVNFAGNNYRRGPSSEIRTFEIILDRKAAPDSPKLFTCKLPSAFSVQTTCGPLFVIARTRRRPNCWPRSEAEAEEDPVGGFASLGAIRSTAWCVLGCPRPPRSSPGFAQG